MAPRLRRMLPLLLATAVLLPGGPVAGPAVATTTPTIAQLIGQKLVVAMSGTTPSASLLGRIQRGEIGGVILFGANITSAAQLRSLTDRLAAAAAAGGQPKLLITTDQEGGDVARLGWAPPTLSAPEMGALGSVTTASAQGKAAGYILRCAGINSDLAPVADLPASSTSFMYRDGRTWSFDASVTAKLSDAFASGLEAGGDVPAMKHFPGIGLATANTDTSVVTITASKSTLAPGLLPYQAAIAHGIPMIMLSNATYPAYDAANAASWSHAIGVDLLRTQLGFQGVTMTDSLNGTAAARGVSATSLAIRAAAAGTDMLLLTGSEAGSATTYASLVRAAQDGTIALAPLRASYARILALKSTLKSAVADTTPPTVGAPGATLITGSTLGTTGARVRISWSASDPCGVAQSTVERRVNAGAWATQTLTNPVTSSVTQSLTFGSTYRFAARRADGAGNVGAWAYGRTFEPFVRQSTSSLVRSSAGWSTVTSTGYSGGVTRYASTAGASASYSFTGTSIGWVAALGPTRGSAKVYIDGTYQATVSLYATTTSLRRIGYVRSWSSQAGHTIKIVVVGTAGHPRVDLDAFVRLYQP
jgi:beta-N-acetylhexosaminidase